MFTIWSRALIMFIPEAMRLDPTWLDSYHAPNPGLAIIVKSNAQMNRSSLSGSYVTISFAAIGIASTALSVSALRTRGIALNACAS